MVWMMSKTFSSAEDTFQHATLVATLAEKFNLTFLNRFKKQSSLLLWMGEIQPTGSGKSLCFQFLPVYLEKKAIIVTPTISLMQDQVHKFNSIGISSVLFGSAQLDKQVEVHALKPENKECLIFVIPEWVAKPANQLGLHSLIQASELSRIVL
jgi:superfamily II DNA helicase RecQ